MNRVKKVPLRKCIVTNERYPKMEMFRVVRDPNGEVVIDPTGKMNGHGAYISKSLSAINTAKKKKALDRHLELPVPEAIYDRLIELLKESNETK